jgi:hypothetical protein
LKRGRSNFAASLALRSSANLPALRALSVTQDTPEAMDAFLETGKRERSWNIRAIRNIRWTIDP